MLSRDTKLKGKLIQFSECNIEVYDGNDFGRRINFGKYKGHTILYIIRKDPQYADWLNNNTDFKLTEVEKWWIGMCKKLFGYHSSHTESTTNFLHSLSRVASDMEIYNDFPIDNPHWIVE